MTLLIREWEYYIDPLAGCWLWKRALTRAGYAARRIDGRTQLVHGWMYKQKRGRIPRGKQLDHLCRTRHCINPDHLEIVSNAENSRRGRKAKLTMEDAREIRRRYALGGISTRELGREYGVYGATISNIMTGKRWKEGI